MKNIFTIINLQLFDDVINTTTTGAVNGNGDGVWGGSGLSPQMKIFYDKHLIRFAAPKLVHRQFAQKRPIPKNGGKVIEFRRYAPLPKATTPLTEGVTPPGSALNVSTLTSTVQQYGDFVRITDMVSMTAIDNNLVEATEMIGDQAGLTMDTLTRNAINSGLNVSFASKWNGTTETKVDMRSKLDKTAVLTVKDVKKVVAKLRAANAPTIDGKYYAAIIHPHTEYHIMNDPHWENANAYTEKGQENIYAGEIGRIGGVRFFDSSEAMVFKGEGLTAGSASLTVKTAISESSASVAVKELITTDDVSAFAARDSADKYAYIGGVKTAISALVAGAAGSASITLANAVTTLAADTVINDIGGAGDGSAVYSTLFFGKNAFGTTEITGGGMQTIIKPLGSGEDPLNQRATVGWKGTDTDEILVERYLVRVESCSDEFEYTEAV